MRSLFLSRPLSGTWSTGRLPSSAVDSNSAGTGKTKIPTCVGIIVDGSRTDIRPLPNDDDEIRKKITAELRVAPSLVLLDNAKSSKTVDSSALAALTTSTIWTDRELGFSRNLTFPNRSVWIITGNNLSLSLELTRRSVHIRLFTERERPWERSGFLHADLEEWVENNRRLIVRSILMLVRSWLAAGRPAAPKKEMGSFQSFSKALGGILHHAGIPGFLENRAAQYATADGESQALREFVQLWWHEFASTKVRTHQLLALCTRENLLGEALGGGTDRARSTKLGMLLSSHRQQTFGGLRIEHDGSRSRGCYYLVRVGNEGDPRRPCRPSADLQQTSSASGLHRISDDGIDGYHGGADLADLRADRLEHPKNLEKLEDESPQLSDLESQAAIDPEKGLQGLRTSITPSETTSCDEDLDPARSAKVSEGLPPKPPNRRSAGTADGWVEP